MHTDSSHSSRRVPSKVSDWTQEDVSMEKTSTGASRQVYRRQVSRQVFGLVGLISVCVLTVFLIPGCGLLGGDEDTTPPQAPADLSAASGTGASSLQWSAPEADDLEGYNVYRSEDAPIDVETSEPLNAGGLVSETSFTDQGAENGTTYRYRVTAVDNSNNESVPSDSARVTPFADPPSRP